MINELRLQQKSKVLNLTKNNYWEKNLNFKDIIINDSKE